MRSERLGAAGLKAAAAAAGACIAPPAFAESPDRGFQVGASYTSDTFLNLDGGLKRGFSQMGLLELTADARGDVAGLAEITAHASIQYVHGRSLSGKLIGDAQVTSNIDAPNGVRLFEAWVSMPVGENGHVKAGMIDLNSEFDVQDVGALFLNSSHGVGPDFSQNAPSIFPTTSSAVMGAFTKGRLTVRAGLFDALAGDPDHPARTVIRFLGESGLLAVGETELALAEDAKLKVGAWAYTSRFEVLGNEPEESGRGNTGVYSIAEARVGSVRGHPLDAWVRLGLADETYNPVGLYVGGGLAAGPEEKRFGIAVAHARLGSPARRETGTERAETVIELTFAQQIGDRLIVQPDVQYVINPGFARSVRNSLSAGVRLQLTLF